MTSVPFCCRSAVGVELWRFCHPHPIKPGKGMVSTPQRGSQTAGPPGSLWPQRVLSSPHQLISVSRLPPRARPRAPHLANTVGHSPGAHTKPGSSGLGSRPDTHPMAWPWTQALLCLGVKEHLSPFLPSPSIQHWACQGGLRGSLMNGFIQQYKLSTYCVPGRRQPHLHPTALCLVQIKVQLQGRQAVKHNRASGLRGKLPEEE